jgi:hypothetical protein
MYRASGTKAVGSSVSPLTVMGGTGVVCRIKEYQLSTSGAPTTEAEAEIQARRFTAAGTGTSQTPSVSNGGAFPASEATVLVNLSAEPTYTAGFVTDDFFNPRNTRFWQAIDELAKLYTPLTASNGIGFQMIGAGGAASNATAQALWDE